MDGERAFHFTNFLVSTLESIEFNLDGAKVPYKNLNSINRKTQALACARPARTRASSALLPWVTDFTGGSLDSVSLSGKGDVGLIRGSGGQQVDFSNQKSIQG